MKKTCNSLGISPQNCLTQHHPHKLMMAQSSLQEIEEAFDLTFMNFSELIAA